MCAAARTGRALSTCVCRLYAKSATVTPQPALATLALTVSRWRLLPLSLCWAVECVSSTTAERYSSFWRSQTECLARLYRSRLLTIAAIRGSCPAGGCILALCCDYRLLTANGSMGLNEAALSMPVPDYWMRVMSRTVGWRRTEAMLQKGLLLDASQAKQCGLVDEVVDDGAALLSAAEREAAERLKVPEVGRTASKRLMREQLSQEWEAQWRSEADSSWKLLSADETVTQIRRVLQRLSANKATNAQQHKPAKL